MRSAAPILLLILSACDQSPLEQTGTARPSEETPAATPASESHWPVPAPTRPPERSEIRQLLPVDHALRSPSFVRFRDELLIAAREKDHKTVLESVSPVIRTTFGAGGGLEDFQDMWHPEEPVSALWIELPAVLELGGSFTDGTLMKNFCAPYTYSEWPDDLDAFEHVVVILPGTLLKPSRDAAEENSTPLGYEFLRIAEGDPVRSGNPAAGWRKVETFDNKTGWVQTDHVRSPIDYRACFSETAEGWKMTLFVAGD